MFYNLKTFLQSEFAGRLSDEEIQDLKYLTKIFPFKASRYVLEELVDWENRDTDPIFRLVFPRREMLKEHQWRLLKSAKTLAEEREAIRRIRWELNPHPDGQKDNIPVVNGHKLGGIQYKYRETVLFFPAQGQTCHSHCTYCFRWAQFVRLDEHKFRSNNAAELYEFLEHHKEVTDVLLTGGDPLWMSNRHLFPYIDLLLKPELAHVQNIRIGSKALSFYPQRFLGKEGDELLQKLESAVRAGKSVALMAHFTHYREMETEKVQEAVRRIRNAGVVIRTQSPIVKGINDDAEVWRRMWREQVRMGMVPYYMFIARDTGAHHYFSVPLYKAYQVFTEAYSTVSGLSKTVRGPSMSAWPGKVLISGVMDVNDERKFVLKFIQCREPRLINKPFTARFDPEATWFDELEIDSPMREEIGSLYEQYGKSPSYNPVPIQTSIFAG